MFMSIIQQLRQLVAASGKTQVEIERDTGIRQPTMSRFLRGERGLNLADIDKLAEYLGVELRPAAPKEPAKRRKA